MGNNSLPIRINKNNFLQTKLKKLGSFDVKFTREPVSLNPGPKDIDVDHEQFKGFLIPILNFARYLKVFVQYVIVFLTRIKEVITGSIK